VALFWKINLTKIRLPELWINGQKFLRGAIEREREREREKARRNQFVKLWLFCRFGIEDKRRSQLRWSEK
jgi:hypothetical protein